MRTSSSSPAPQEQDHLVEHLGFIQAIVARQASNCFLLKGWSVTLVAAIFALAAKDADAGFVWIALLPILGFWALDAYYLHQEKRFRLLFDWVRKGMNGLSNEQRQNLGPFCLDPDCVPVRERCGVGHAWNRVFSPSVWPFYSLLLGAVLLGIFALRQRLLPNPPEASAHRAALKQTRLSH